MPTIIHKIGPKIDNNTFEISQFYFPVSQIGHNTFKFFQIGAKKSVNLGLVSDRIEIGFNLHWQICVSRSVRGVRSL